MDAGVGFSGEALSQQVTWTVAFSRRCDDDILRMTPTVASSICRAVLELAEAGGGDAEQDGRLLVLRADGGVALIRVNEQAKTLHVSRLIADHPLPSTGALLDEPEPPSSKR